MNAGLTAFAKAGLDAAGSSLRYSTYLGGSSGFESASSIAVDATGNAYVTGVAKPGFPVTAGAYRTTCGCASTVGDAAVVMIGPTGTMLYSTYLGGTGHDGADAITVDSTGNAYVAGSVDYGIMPVTAGVFQTTSAGNTDIWIAKLDSAGSRLLYLTLLGDSGYDVPQALPWTVRAMRMSLV